MYMDMYMYIYTYTNMYVYRENGTDGKWQLHLFAANRKRKFVFLGKR